VNASTKARYIAWAARGWLGADRSCPGCGSTRTRLLKRKHLVTALFGCETCGLMFRMPKSSQAEDQAFYQLEYRQGGTTELPDPSELHELQRLSFAPIGRDYSRSRRCSRPARFATDYLGCRVLAEPQVVPEQVDCFFASHVLEHLAHPQTLWQLASDVVKPDGAVVLFVPNGEPGCELRDPERYHRLWGRVHPLLLTGAAVRAMAARHQFDACAYSSPFDLDCIAAGRAGLLDGDELLLVARRRT
jgi:SAM-dependent methyltransferase